MSPRQQPLRAEPVVPPQNLEAEEAVLGAMLVSPRAVDAVAELLGPDDFYRPSYGTIFTTCLRLSERGEPVDVITVLRELEERGELEQVGGRAKIHELGALVPPAANVAHHARIVREIATLRELVRAGSEIARLGQEQQGDVRDLVDRAEQIVFALAQTRERSDFVSIGDVVPDAYRRLVERHAGGKEVVGLSTGLVELDRQTSGFRSGNLIVVAARPSMGKSALALTLAGHAALHDSIPVALFTLEMSRDEVTERLVAAEAAVDSQRIQTGRLDTEEWARVTAAFDRVGRAPLLIDDSPTATVTEVRSRARRLKSRLPELGLVVIDYLQLMTSGETQENRNQDVSAISRSLKALARELDVPVVALSQLSRQPEQRHDKRPLLSDLRESGSIEQDADLVAFIYRDEYYHPEDTDQQGIAEVNIAKQRNGPTGTIKLAFVRRYARFGNLARPEGT